MAYPKKQPFERKPSSVKKYGITSAEYQAMFDT